MGSAAAGASGHVGRRLVSPSGADRVLRAGDEPLDPLVRRDRLFQRVLRVIEGGPVVRLAEVVPQFLRPHLGQRLGGRERAPLRLAHLPPGEHDQAVVHPVPGETVPGGRRLGALVLVVREDQVDAATVDIESGPEVMGGHRRALEVPARPARTPGGPPGRLAGLRALPQDEVVGVSLERSLGARAPRPAASRRVAARTARRTRGRCARRSTRRRRPGRHARPRSAARSARSSPGYGRWPLAARRAAGSRARRRPR